MVERLAAHTGLHAEDVDDLVAWIRHDLAKEIQKAVDSPYYQQAELSELLANAGILPMFGFPTRSRTSTSQASDLASDLDNHSLSDRPLDQAISAFAPGAEITREGDPHLCRLRRIRLAARRPWPSTPLVPRWSCGDARCVVRRTCGST